MANPSGSQSLSTALDVRPAVFHDNQRRSFYEDFRGPVSGRATSTPFGNPTGVTGDVNTLLTAGNAFQYHILGTQTILGPARVAGGLDITQDLTSGDGVEYVPGIVEDPANTVVATAEANGFVYKVGTDRPFYVSLRFKITDVSGTAKCAVGFRKAEAFQALLDDYFQMAMLNVVSGAIKVETVLDNAANVVTDTTQAWADLETHTLTVIVDSDGSLFGTARAVYYEIDGAKPTVVPTTLYKFNNGEFVVPFFYFLNTVDVAESTVLRRWEAGFIGVGDTTQLAKQ